MSVNEWDFSIVAPSTNMPHGVMKKILDDKDHPITKTIKDGDIVSEKADSMGLLHHIREEFAPISIGKELYTYDPNQCYHRRDDDAVEKIIAACLQMKGIYDPGAVRKAMANLTHVTRDYPFVGGIGTLNFINGVFDIRANTLTPHAEIGIYDYIIKTPFIPQETRELDELLSLYGTDEPVSVLAKCLWQRAWLESLKEMTVFYGEPDSGKTTMGELVQATLDGSLNALTNTARVTLDKLLADFGIAPLEHKLFNLGDDLPDKLVKNSQRIADFVGSINHNVEHKGVDGYQGKITAYNLFTTNNLPPLDDDDASIWGKLRLVECRGHFPRGAIRDEIFTDKIKQQMVVKAVALILKWQTEPYRNDQTPEDVRRIWREATDDAEIFFNELVIPDYSGRTKYDDVKRAYEGWCITNGKATHFKNLNRVLRPYYKHTMNERYYTVFLREQKPPNPFYPVKSKEPEPDISGTSNLREPIITPEPKPVSMGLVICPFDIDHHTKFIIRDSKCNIEGCNSPGVWHDGRTHSHSLCDAHYQRIREMRSLA
jgi:phage/plasmid-associated DNA primase